MGHDLRIYVASLSDYNAGRLLGVWVDLDENTTGEDIYQEVKGMLRKSPEPVAEEWAIHDHEGFGPLTVDEHETFDNVATLGRGLTEHGEAFAAYVSHVGSVDDASDFEDAYQGTFDSRREFAEHLADETGFESPTEWPGSYIDWEAAARDLFVGGDYFDTAASGWQLHVFRSI